MALVPISNEVPSGARNHPDEVAKSKRCEPGREGWVVPSAYGHLSHDRLACFSAFLSNHVITQHLGPLSTASVSLYSINKQGNKLAKESELLRV